MKRSTLILACLAAVSAGCGGGSGAAPIDAAPSAYVADRPTPACGLGYVRFDPGLYPFTSRCIDLGFGALHYLDESPPESSGLSAPRGTVLMVHGNPTSSFLYRNVALGLLARGYRVIAPDHHGFGRSAKPDARAFAYRPSDHANVLESFVDRLDLRDFTLVVQDWGGPVGLAMAVERAARVRNLLVMNTWAWQVEEADAQGPYGDLIRWSISNRENSAAVIADASIPRGVGELLASYAPPEQRTAVRDAYWSPFIDPASGQPWSPTVAAPTNTFARSILEDRAIFDRLGTLSPLAGKPVTFFFGQRDPYFGALTPNPDGSCASGAPGSRDGRTYCLAAGQLQYPYIVRWRALWQPGAVRGVEIDPNAEHFIQETAAPRIVELIDALNRGF